MNHSGKALLVCAGVLALNVVLTAYGDDPPNCAAAEVSVTDHVVDAGVWGRSYYVDIHHNGVYWIRLRYKGSEEMIQVLTNPVSRQFDRNCLEAGETLQIEAWKTMRFERELQAYAEPVSSEELKEGSIYFFVNFVDGELLTS